MATINEILAARKAAAAKTAATPAPTAPVPSPAKAPATSAGNVRSPVLSAFSGDTTSGGSWTAAGKAVKAFFGATEPVPPPRTLGEMTPDVPFVFPSPSDSPSQKSWKAALLTDSTKLGVAVEPNGEHAWLAVQAEGQAELLLLYRLPLLSLQQTGQPF